MILIFGEEGELINHFHCTFNWFLEINYDEIISLL